MNFVIKSLAPIVAGGGLGTGGVYAYRSVIPTTWQEYLEREGFRIIDTSDTNTDKANDFKAVFVDNEDARKRVDSLQSESDANSAHSKVETWCKEELKKNTDYNATTKDNLIKLCTYSGIHTVKGKISQKGKLNWVKDSESENKYKTLFAIYKYSSNFLNWLNEGKSDGKITSSDKPSEKYTELKNKCESESRKKHEDNKEKKELYNHVYWWCMALSYDTIQDRINQVDKSWQKETDKSKIENTWKHTKSITSAIKTDQSKGETELQSDDYESWCTSKLSQKLYDDGIYQEKYLQVKSVCKKIEETTK